MTNSCEIRLLARSMHRRSEAQPLSFALTGNEPGPMPAGATGDAVRGEVLSLWESLAAENENMDWWYLPVSELQPFMSLLPEALDLRACFMRLAAKGEPGAAVLLVANGYLARFLMQDEALKRAGLRIRAEWRDRLWWQIDRLKTPLRRWVNAVAWLRENLANWRDSRWRDDSAVYGSKVHTLFFSRLEGDPMATSPNWQSGPWRDVYLGGMPQAGFERTGAVALLGRCGSNAVGMADTVTQYRPFPVRTVQQLLDWPDFLSAFWRALRLQLKVSRRDALGNLVLAESRNHVRAVADCILVEKAVARAIALLRPAQIICMQENCAWEHAVVRAGRQATPTPHLVGYFHCPVVPSAWRYHISEELLSGARSRPMFDAVVPLGDAMSAALGKLGPWSRRLKAGYGFRNPDIAAALAMRPAEMGRPLRVVVVLGGTYDNAAFLRWVYDACRAIPDLAILIKGHPVFGSITAIRGAGLEHMMQPAGNIAAGGLYDISANTVAEALQQAHCVIYKGTTVSISALAAGIPVIHVDHGGPMTDDVLFNAEGLNWRVSSFAQMQAAVQDIRTMSAVTRQDWARRARTYAAGYYNLSPEREQSVLDSLFVSAGLDQVGDSNEHSI